MTTRTAAARALTLALAFATLAALRPRPARAGKIASDQADAIEAYPRDVHVIVGSSLRTPDATTPSSAPLFNDAGVNLGITWGQWIRLSVSSTMTVTTALFGGYKTDVSIALKGLVPGGVYSVFYGLLQPDSMNPLCPGVERTLPFPTPDTSSYHPDASSFIADTTGSATYLGRVSGNLLVAGQVYITIVYHFDRRTYDTLPNIGEYLTQGPNCRSSFGEDAFRHVLILQKW
jgi:hypothetical protein